MIPKYITVSGGNPDDNEGEFQTEDEAVRDAIAEIEAGRSTIVYVCCVVRIAKVAANVTVVA